MFLVMRSEGLTTLRINLKFGRSLILTLDDGLEAQDISANATEYHFLFCDDNDKKNSNINSYIKRNKIMIFADLDRDVFFLEIICIQPGDTNSFITNSRTTSPNNKNAEYLTVQ